MKNLVVIFFLLVAVQGVGQKRKKADAKDVQIDTLTKANSVLTVQLDSVYKMYNGLYATVKEKITVQDFDPARLSQLIDSIRAREDSVALLQSAPLKDSIAQVNKRNVALKTELDSVKVAFANHKKVPDTADKTKLMAELKDLKALLDAKIITQAEFDTKKKLIMEKWQ